MGMGRRRRFGEDGTEGAGRRGRDGREGRRGWDGGDGTWGWDAGDGTERMAASVFFSFCSGILRRCGHFEGPRVLFWLLPLLRAEKETSR